MHHNTSKTFESNQISFGELIRTSRVAANIDLKTLAQGIGISPAYWSRIERDKELPPSDDLIKKAANFLGIALDTAFTTAKRLPPDLRNQLREIVEFARRQK